MWFHYRTNQLISLIMSEIQRLISYSYVQIIDTDFKYILLHLVCERCQRLVDCGRFLSYVLQFTITKPVFLHPQTKLHINYLACDIQEIFKIYIYGLHILIGHQSNAIHCYHYHKKIASKASIK